MNAIIQRLKRLVTSEPNTQLEPSKSAPSIHYEVHRLKGNGLLYSRNGAFLVKGASESFIIDVEDASTFGLATDGGVVKFWSKANPSDDMTTLAQFPDEANAKYVYDQVLFGLTGRSALARASGNNSPHWAKRAASGLMWAAMGFVILVALALVTAPSGTGQHHDISVGATSMPMGSAMAQAPAAGGREPSLEELAAGAAYTPNIKVTPPQVEIPTLSCAPK